MRAVNWKSKSKASSWAVSECWYYDDKGTYDSWNTELISQSRTDIPDNVREAIDDWLGVDTRPKK